MAISASTFNMDEVSRSDDPKSVFESLYAFLSSSISFNQGDQLCYDTSANTVRVVASTSDAANILGLASYAVVNGIPVGPYQGLATTGSIQKTPVRGAVFGITARMILKSGDAFTPGCKVYLADGLDSQTVSVTDPGDHNCVGLFAGVAVTGDGATRGPVKYGARYPNGTGGALSI